MTGAIAAMVLAALESELALRYRRAGDAYRLRRHRSWALWLCGVGFYCALNDRIFG